MRNLSILIILLIKLLCCSSASSFLLSSNTQWNDLKVTWGLNPFDSKFFVSLPRTEAEAREKGWKREKNCSQVNGNRYMQNGDRAVMLIFNANGIIAGVASGIPKGLPFNFPSKNIRKFFNDEGDLFSLSAYFVDPDSVCSNNKSTRQITGNRLVFKSKEFEVEAPLNINQMNSFWTEGSCFSSMGMDF